MKRASAALAVTLLVLAIVSAGVATAQSPDPAGSGGAVAGPAAPNPAAKIEARVLADTAGGRQTSFVVLLAAQADLRSAYSMHDQTARGWYVYNTLTGTAAQTQGPILALLRARGVPYQSFWAANAVVAGGDRALVETLAARADVRVIESNAPSRWIADPAPAAGRPPAAQSPATVEWGVQNVRAPEVWALGYTGQGMVIGNADTGMQWDHPALQPHYRGWNGTTADHNYNWHDAIHDSQGNPCGNNSPFPCDDFGHGTHTTGTTSGDDGNGNQIGVAPGAKWIGCRNMDQGNGTPARYTECFQFFIAPTDLNGQNPRPDLRPDVINNSWTCPPSEGCAATTLQTIVENTQAAGIFVEASAGNSGPGCSSVSDPPALYAAAFSTGAIDSSDTLASFSSRGPVTADGSNRLKPDISAPGVNVRSSIRGNAYGFLSGTSMAGPHVVGSVALLWSAHPELARLIAQTKTILEQTANPGVTVSPPQTCGGTPSNVIPNNSFGYGRVDAFAAVSSIPFATPTGTVLASATPTRVPSATPTRVPSATPTRVPSATPTHAPSATATAHATATCPAVDAHTAPHTVGLGQPATPALVNNRPGKDIVRGSPAARRAHKAGAWQSTAPISFVLDDGSQEASVGLNDGTTNFPGIWLNRFSPAAGDYPIHLNQISIQFPDPTSAGEDLTGHQIDLLVYLDADGDGNPANATKLLQTSSTVQVANGVTFSTYPIDVVVPGPGDIYLGFADTYNSGGRRPATYPAGLDTDASQGRSWIAGMSSNGDPDYDHLGNNDLLATVDDFGLAGNWTIRASGDTQVAYCPSPTVTGTPPSATPTRTHTNTPTVTPTPCTAPDPVRNGDFETGDLSGWTIDGINNVPFVQSSIVFSGTHAAQLGVVSGPEPSGDSAFFQAITVPSGGGTLSYWYWPFTQDSITFDWQDAYITDAGGNTVLATIMHVDEGDMVWKHKTFDLAPYAGQTVGLKFLVHEDGFGDDTAMYVDAVTVQALVACPSATATATAQATATASRTATASATVRPTSTATPRPTATRRATATLTATATVRPTATARATATRTATRTVTATPRATATARATATVTVAATSTVRATATAGTPTPATTATSTRLPATPTARPSATHTPVPPSATPCALSFSDVHPGDYFYGPVLYLACHGVVSGYADGTYRPYNNTTRAQMVKIVVGGFAVPAYIPPDGGHTFADVLPSQPFFAYIEAAAHAGIVSGYACGAPGETCDPQHRPYFRPNVYVTRGQLTKIVVRAAGWAPLNPPSATFADVFPNTAFYTYVETAFCHGIISGYSCGSPGESCDPQHRPYFRQYANATRGQIAKIVYLALTNPPGTCPAPQPAP